jgi:sugar phosphate isomerase/epimerase
VWGIRRDVFEEKAFAGAWIAMNQRTNRRGFLSKGAALLAGGLTCARAVENPVEDGGGQVRLGGPVFGTKGDPDELARAHRELGYAAAYCPNVSLSDGAAVRAYARAFERAGVVIAEVGRWVNLMHGDPVQRKANFEQVVEGLALADEIGALCCVDIAGSMNPGVWYGPHPDNLTEDFFDAAVENARKIVDAVKPRRAKFCYEMMGWALPDSPVSCMRMIKAVGRPGFGAHLDPCNLINSPRRFYRSKEVVDECFRMLGPHIVSCHAKDLRWEVEMNIHFVEVIPGTGMLDYGHYLRLLSRLPQRPPLMLEHLKNAEEYDQGRRFILEAGGKVGVTFEGAEA